MHAFIFLHVYVIHNLKNICNTYLKVLMYYFFKNQNPLVLLYNDSTPNTIIGGKRIYFYELICKDGSTSVTHISGM